MSDMEMNEFDLKLRSMLEDAEVKPSPRVWKAVSGRMFPAPAAPVWRGWLWGAAVSLAAAAVALGVFLKPSSPLRTVSPADEEVPAVLAQVAPSETSSDAVAPAEEPVVVRESGSRPVVRIALEAVEPEDEPAASGEEETVRVSEPESGECEETPAPAAVETSGEVETEGLREFTIADLERQADKKVASSRVSLSVSGLLSGNQSEFNIPNYNQHLTPGTSVPKTGVEEIGDSSFGLPVTVGLGVRIHCAPRLAVATGVDWTLLSRKFTGEYTKVSETGIIETQAKGDVTHTMNYIGVPLNLVFKPLSGERIDFYVYGGGEVEFCVGNKYVIRSSSNVYDWSKDIRRPQWSVGVGLGVQFNVTKLLGIYLDPGLRYYFNCDQPKNLRTQNPLMFNLNAGLRFNL